MAAANPTTRSQRTVPTQRRAEQTVEQLLDAFAALVHAHGYEQVTTARVAEEAGVSIGLVYRYFPNRIALAEALVHRNRTRFFTRLVERLDEPGIDGWRPALDAVLDTFVELHSGEPGFSVVGFADEFLRSHGVPSDLDNRGLAEGFVVMYRDRFDDGRVEVSDADLEHHMEVAVEIGNALINRAVAKQPGGDPAMIATCRRVLRGYFAELLDP